VRVNEELLDAWNGMMTGEMINWKECGSGRGLIRTLSKQLCIGAERNKKTSG
jgi:hypothetical protein